MTVHYSEGSARAVVRNGTVVVLPGPASADVVDALWTALDRADGGVAATLGVLAAGGLAETPPFAVVSLSGSDPVTAAHVAVRGTGVKVVVTAEGGGTPVEVTGAGVVTWSERVVNAPMSFAITTDEPPADTEYPVQAAVVRASALRRTLVDAPAAPDALVVPAEEKPGAGTFPGFSTRADSSPVLTEPQVSGETMVPGALDAPMIGSGSAPSSPVPSAEPAETEPAPVLESVPMLGLGVVPGPDAPAGTRGEVDESTQFGGDDDYGHLFGDTVMRRVEDAAVRQGEDEEEHEEAHAPAPVPPPPLAPAEPEPVALEPADPGDGLISGVPGSWTPPVLAPEPPAGVTPGAAQRAASVGEPAVEAPGEVTDHDGETMMSVDIAALRKDASSPVPKFSAAVVPGAQQILGRPCPQGHPNPPTAERCRTCGADLDGDAELVPRPALGQMIVTGGVQQTPGRPQVVELDRPVVVGRRPRTNNASADRTPRLVTVASPDQDISRSHVEITLEEWHVLVADLATTNGTTLLRAGQAPRRLHPNEKVIVVEGDVVDLGDGATLTFEGIW